MKIDTLLPLFNGFMEEINKYSSYTTEEKLKKLFPNFSNLKYAEKRDLIYKKFSEINGLKDFFIEGKKKNINNIGDLKRYLYLEKKELIGHLNLTEQFDSLNKNDFFLAILCSLNIEESLEMPSYVFFIDKIRVNIKTLLNITEFDTDALDEIGFFNFVAEQLGVNINISNYVQLVHDKIEELHKQSYQ